MLISYNDLLPLLSMGVVLGSKPEHINSASIDICLGPKILVEGNTSTDKPVRLNKKGALHTSEFDITNRSYYLRPGYFILAQSLEIFNLPDHISAEYKLKSSMARIGLEHLNAGWCDAGWNGSCLTLELKNMTRYHTIELNYGDKIGQMVFFQHSRVPEDKSYAVRGSYNGDATVQGVKVK